MAQEWPSLLLPASALPLPDPSCLSHTLRGLPRPIDPPQVKSHLQRCRTAYVADLLQRGEPVDGVSEAQLRWVPCWLRPLRPLLGWPEGGRGWRGVAPLTHLGLPSSPSLVAAQTASLDHEIQGSRCTPRLLLPQGKPCDAVQAAHQERTCLQPAPLAAGAAAWRARARSARSAPEAAAHAPAGQHRRALGQQQHSGGSSGGGAACGQWWGHWRTSCLERCIASVCLAQPGAGAELCSIRRCSPGPFRQLASHRQCGGRRHGASSAAGVRAR